MTSDRQPLDVFTFRVPRDLADKISDRARELGISRSAYARQILEKWVKDSCPPVSKADAGARLIDEAEKKKAEISPSHKREKNVQ